MLSRGFSSTANTGYVSTNQLIAGSSKNTNVAASLLSTDGNSVMTGSFKTSTLTVGDGSVNDLVINGVNLGTTAQETADLVVEGTFNTVIQTWDYNATSVFGKTARLLRTYHDNIGTKYALIKTTYNWNLNFASSLIGYDTNNRSDAEMNVLAMMNTAVSQNLYYKDIYEIVVIGFSFREKNSRIAIPNFVRVPYFMDNILPENETYDGYYPVREIWGCHIYATTTQNSTVHLLSAEELSNPSEIIHVPTSFSAPYITKITLKHKIDNNLWFFSGVGPKIFAMPNLVKIVGLSDMYKAPVICGLNMAGRELETLSFPALKEIKNCLFGCVNNSLYGVELPELERLEETTFFCSCPEIIELDLPMLNVIRGCDFFLAQCTNLEVLRLNAYIKFQPHECMPTLPEGSRANIHDANYFLEVLNAVMLVIGLTPQFSAYRRFGGSNSMSFFLKDCKKLAQYTKVSAGMASQYNIKREKGIHLHYSNIGGVPCYLEYAGLIEGQLIETYGQYINRINRENQDSTGWVRMAPEATASDAGLVKLYGSDMQSGTNAHYYIDSVANVMLFSPTPITAGNNPTPITDLVVCPIDPRSAFLADSSDGVWVPSSTPQYSETLWKIIYPNFCDYIDIPAKMPKNYDEVVPADVPESVGMSIQNWFTILFGWRNAFKYNAVDNISGVVAFDGSEDADNLPLNPIYKNTGNNSGDNTGDNTDGNNGN